MEGNMAKAFIALALSLLCVTFLYGYKVISKGQLQSETITIINGKSATGKDVENSKRFPKYKTGRKLTDPTFFEQQSNEIVVKKRSPIIDVPLERRCPKYPKSGLVGLAHAADVIVVGAIKDKTTSQLTDDEDFLFSEYSLSVEILLKDNPSAPIELNSDISIIRPGGKVSLNGKTITAITPSFRPFIQGSRYVLFLKFIPETQSYQAFGNGSFPVEEGEVRTSNDSRIMHKQQEFIAEVKDAIITEPCQIVVLN
jgi:hypothetical protein